MACLLYPLAAQTASGQGTLETYPVDGSGVLEYRLVTGGQCDDEACSARLVLARGERELSAAELTRAFVADLDPTRHEGCWVTRVEGAHLEICPSLVRLAPELNGVMLSQRRGWDHVRQRQMLFVALDDSLVMVWEQDNGIGGPYWTKAWVTDTDGDGTDEIVSLTEAEGYMPDQTDTWYLVTLGWDPARRDVRRVSEPGRALAAYAVIVGSYPTLDEAREYQERVGYITNEQGRRVGCLPGFRVLSSSEYPRLVPDWFIIAALTIDEAEAGSKLERAKACNPSIDGYLKRVQ
jgi:hypothetical protein